MRLKSCRGKNDTTTMRSWDEMNYDLLLVIMKRLSWSDRLSSACMVSKTWLSAVLDSLSPPGVINLKVLDSPKFPRNRYCVFVKRRLGNLPADSCYALFHGKTCLQEYKYRYIAKRTPSMQQLIISREVGNTASFILPAMRYWKKLKKVHCPSVLLPFCPRKFSEVESLRLFGPVDDDIAAIIRDRCPRLKKLRLDYCALSVSALSTILDGHKDLELLDTRHSFRVADCRKFQTANRWVSRSLEWNGEEIRRKAAGVKVHLECAREHCGKCAAPFRTCFPELKGGCKRSSLPTYL